MADRTSAALFAELFSHLAGFNKDGSQAEPTARDRTYAHECWEKLRDYGFRPYQMGCEEALEILGLARKVLDRREAYYGGPVQIDGSWKWLYGPKSETK